MTNNYFKIVESGQLFFFNDRLLVTVLAAWESAKASCHGYPICVWDHPATEGPWRDCREIGESPRTRTTMEAN